MKSLFEEMGGTYTLGADGMYYPDLELPEEEPHYGKYGRMRLRYLKEHHKIRLLLPFGSNSRVFNYRSYSFFFCFFGCGVSCFGIFSCSLIERFFF